MTPEPDPARADHVFDGGDLDCGSGLVLLIRENMQRVPPGGVLELRSREATVASDLPPWCRMVGHEFLGQRPGAGTTRYFVRRGAGTAAVGEAQALADDQRRAREYEWRVRVRRTGPQQATAYARNRQFAVGQPASFEERDELPSAVEFVLGALGADLAATFAACCDRRGLVLDDLELTTSGRLHDVFAHLGSSDGDPSFAAIVVKCFATSSADESELQAAWTEATRRSPLCTTLAKATTLTTRLVPG